MEILIVCKHQEIAATIARLIDTVAQWRATVALCAEAALNTCTDKKFDVILIGSGISQTEEDNIRTYLEANNTETPVVKHYGGGSGLLYAEIYQATAK